MNQNKQSCHRARARRKVGAASPTGRELQRHRLSAGSSLLERDLVCPGQHRGKSHSPASSMLTPHLGTRHGGAGCRLTHMKLPDGSSLIPAALGVRKHGHLSFRAVDTQSRIEGWELPWPQQGVLQHPPNPSRPCLGDNWTLPQPSLELCLGENHRLEGDPGQRQESSQWMV